jgi:chromosomal replication initiator protein
MVVVVFDMSSLQITPDDMRPIDRDVHTRLITPRGRSPESNGDLKAILTELSLISERINTIASRVGRAIAAMELEDANIGMTTVQHIVAAHFDVSRIDIISARRTRTVVRPRQIAMYLCRVLTPKSLGEIGRCFGGRDHSTVHHAIQVVTRLLVEDPALSKDIGFLTGEILVRGTDDLKHI